MHILRSFNNPFLRRPRIAPLMMAVSVVALVADARSAEDARAFPGAEGAGAFSRGGRGGRVLFVTNLNDAGDGSFREAVEARGPRLVVFRVAGDVELASPVRIANPYITIAGQTAPGDGVCLKNYGLQIGQVHQVIIRHLRCRPGDKNSEPGEMDAITIWNSKNVILDHCSATWSTDECLSVTRDSDQVTVQWCLIAEALTSHSMGSIIGADRGRITFHKNLYANNRSRNPRISAHTYEEGNQNDPGPLVDFRNNVIFNWSYSGGYAGSTDAKLREVSRINYAHNYLKPGPDTRPNSRHVAFRVNSGAVTKMYVAGNLVEGFDNPPKDDWSFIHIDGGSLERLDKPIPMPPVAVVEPRECYADVLDNVGAVLPVRDAVDARIIVGVRKGTGRIVSSQDDVGGWTRLRVDKPMSDQDQDGMPDAWERQFGLDPNDGGDKNGDRDKDGYANIEEFLNGSQPSRPDR